MKVKIIKRSDREETLAKALADESKPKKDNTLRVAVVVVNSWIEELRQKRETEAGISKQLFEEESKKLLA